MCCAMPFDICIGYDGMKEMHGGDFKTYFCTVSESPIIVSERLGRVIATTPERQALPQLSLNPQRKCSNNVPLRRRFSPRNPTSPLELLLTRVTMTASFSRPWKPSTLPSSIPGKASFRGASTAS